MLPATLALALFALPAGGPDRRPVPLRNPPLVSPIAAAGTGVAPEVTVKVEVDARGRVSLVEVAKIQPSTPLDGVFREETVRILSTWRFAPAIEDGVARPATLRWTILFRPLAEGELTRLPDSIGELSPFGPLATAAERRTRRILDLPVQQQASYQAELARKADALVDPKRRQEASNDFFRVVTDSADPKLTQAVAQNLEAVYQILARWFGGRVQPAPARGRVLVYLWDRRTTYEQFASVGGADWASGFYSPAGLIAFHRETSSSVDLVSTLIHETVHAFVDRHLDRPGVDLPRWLGEGLAEYVGNSTVQKGHLIPGKTLRAMPAPDWSGNFVKTQPGLGLLDVKAAVRKGTSIPLESLVSAGPREFYGERMRLYYPQAWLFVHFLRHGRPDWLDRAFPLFLLYMTEGFEPAASFRAAYGSAPAELEGQFKEYVRAF